MLVMRRSPFRRASASFPNLPRPLLQELAVITCHHFIIGNEVAGEALTHFGFTKRSAFETLREITLRILSEMFRLVCQVTSAQLSDR
jgi:hypothetical protein